MRSLAICCITLALVGCIDTYEEEYRATLRELEQTRQALAEAERKLKAADNEVRHEIFTLARRSNNRLQKLDAQPTDIEALADKMLRLLDSYQQLHTEADLTATVARFYQRKLSAIAAIKRRGASAYDQRYSACLASLNQDEKASPLNSMLCEVQADVARNEHQVSLEASIQALTFVGEQLLAARGLTGPLPSLAQAEAQFDEKYSQVTGQAG